MQAKILDLFYSIIYFNIIVLIVKPKRIKSLETVVYSHSMPPNFKV